jgi:AGZA family xanthine/uracil permease-like MFS transporter
VPILDEVATRLEGEQLPPVVFNGTVMRDQPAHSNLARATFVEEVRTAPIYRLYSIANGYPAMIPDDERGASISAELYEVPDEVWPHIRDAEPPGLYRGRVELADGRHVDGMLGELELVMGADAVEITAYGGWREYLASR